MHPERGKAGGQSANKPEEETDKDAGVGGGNANIQVETTKSMQHRTKEGSKLSCLHLRYDRNT